MGQNRRLSTNRPNRLYLENGIVAIKVEQEVVCVLSNSIIAHDLEWFGGVVVRALDLRLERSPVQISTVPLLGNNFGQFVHTHVLLWVVSGVASLSCTSGNNLVIRSSIDAASFQ